MLAGGLLAGCGSDDADAGSPLDVSLDGFVAAAERPTPATLCDPDPADPAATPPGLPAAPGSPDAAFLQSASTTVEGYLWRTEDADAAEVVLAEATTAARACTWTTVVGGAPGTPGSQEQQAEAWSSGDWAGTRIVRTVAGSEQVDRRLVARGAVVLLVVLRADGDDPALLTPADDYLTAVTERLG
ncbi:hypothetical protein DMO24_19025 [Modestobacter versicolor]|uniref:DUF3558 domain-containing protein n=1 Tax=Modestobacter versicolor TaxID=429133 RepID=A0A323V5K8_9ACTN|nr:hypothetical protein DMO24_19025 [Modestobacter versicolor]